MNDALKNIVEPLLAPGQVLLDATEDVRGNFIRITIDSDKGLTLGDTTDLTRSLRDTGDIDSRFPSGFRLEVSTPGLDSPLEHPFQYKRNIDRDLDVVYSKNNLDVKVTGKITSADDNSFELNTKDRIISLSYDQVQTAKVKVSFK